MKNHLLVFIIAVLFVTCDNKSIKNPLYTKVYNEMEIVRFDKLFFETRPQDLQLLKKDYPIFFPINTPDEFWIEKIQNPQWNELYNEVQKKYKDFEPIKENLALVFANIETDFPNIKTPKVFTVIADMDYTNKVIYTDSLLVISLELYLGKAHHFYQFPNYLKYNFEESQILPDVVAAFYKSKSQADNDKTFISKMITAGKQLYFKDALLPDDYQDDQKIGLTPEQLLWLADNEAYIWRYFIEREYLFSTEMKLENRFINPAPFSKFYLEIDNESPGQVGAWIGWQIVRAYMDNNKVTIQELLTKSSKEIFEKSNYKPKK